MSDAFMTLCDNVISCGDPAGLLILADALEEQEDDRHHRLREYHRVITPVNDVFVNGYYVARCAGRVWSYDQQRRFREQLRLCRLVPTITLASITAMLQYANRCLPAWSIAALAMYCEQAGIGGLRRSHIDALAVYDKTGVDAPNPRWWRTTQLAGLVYDRNNDAERWIDTAVACAYCEESPVWYGFQAVISAAMEEDQRE